ncbi:MAG: AI-2E family transporter [Coriobacteriaceae bacterium]|nr:AI-2E family transporter [Coriobacteriaceae bacterium]
MTTEAAPARSLDNASEGVPVGTGKPQIPLAVQESKAKRNFLRVWTVIGAIVLLLVFGYLLNVLAVPIGVVIWSVIIVFCLRTPVSRLEKRGIKRVFGTMIAYGGMFALFALLGLVLFSPVFGIGEQFKNLIESVPGYASQLADLYNELYNQYSGFLQDDMVKTWINEAATTFGAWVSLMAKNSADGLVALGSSVINSFMVVGFSLVVAFWILMELPAIGREARRVIPDKYARDAAMLHLTFTRVMGGYIKATLVQCLCIGIACGIAYAIIGIPNAAALGGIAGLLNIIPVVGPWLGGALAAVVGVFVSPWAALIALIVTIAVQQFIYTFVSPKLMADSVDVHPALVIVALLVGSAVGAQMNGIMGSLVGMLASIPAVAAIKAIFVYYFEHKTGRRVVAEDGVFFKGTPGSQQGRDLDPIADATSPARPVTPRQPRQPKKPVGK